MLVASVVAARMVRWVGASEGLAGRDHRAAFTRIPHGARVAATRPRTSAVVEAMRFARKVVATGPGNKCKS